MIFTARPFLLCLFHRSFGGWFSAFIWAGGTVSFVETVWACAPIIAISGSNSIGCCIVKKTTYRDLSRKVATWNGWLFQVSQAFWKDGCLVLYRSSMWLSLDSSESRNNHILDHNANNLGGNHGTYHLRILSPCCNMYSILVNVSAKKILCFSNIAFGSFSMPSSMCR